MYFSTKLKKNHLYQYKTRHEFLGGKAGGNIVMD